MSKRENEIKIKINLDEQGVPEDIKWSSSDDPNPGLKDTKSFMLSMWDPFERNTLGINLWTKSLTVDEMHAHYFQSLMMMTETYIKATSNPIAREEMDKFCQMLSDKTREWEESKG